MRTYYKSHVLHSDRIYSIIQFDEKYLITIICPVVRGCVAILYII